MGMGFSLNKRVLEAGLVLSLFSFVGCKLPDIKTEETLTKTSADKVRDAIWTELEKVDLHQLQPNQYVFYESNYRAENASVVKVVEVERIVTSVNSVPESTKVAMKEAFRKYSPSGTLEDEKISDVIWTMSKNLQAMSLSSHEFKALSTTSDYDYAEYYNLEAKRVVVDVPAATAAQPNCSGFTNCKINGLEVKYLAHLMKDGNVVKRIQYHVILSAEVPAVFWDEQNPIWPVISECMAHTIGKIYVNECVVLRDAQK